MSLLGLPRELRLQIFSELLVIPEVILLGNDIMYPTFEIGPKKLLWPAVLRVNKMVYSEARALLYSDNRFQFLDVYLSYFSMPAATSYHTHGPDLAPFLKRIGSQASQILHICIPFPLLGDNDSKDAVHVQILTLIRDACTSLRTLELMKWPDQDETILHGTPFEAKVLGQFNPHPRISFPSKRFFKSL
jgi:hypothetical protein